VVLLAGCSGRPVAVAPPSPTPDPDALGACQAFHAALPDRLETVGGRRTTRPDSPLTAAYGDPPASVRCGVPTPAGLSATATLVEVDGVSWYPEELTEGWAMTTVDRVANVEIVVPTAQGPAPSIAADLAPTIRATIPPA
jgi:hypothetical protein